MVTVNHKISRTLPVLSMLLTGFLLLTGSLLAQSATTEPPATPAGEPTLEHCQRLYFERTFNYTSPNYHLLYAYDLEQPQDEPFPIAFSTSFLLQPHWSADGTKVVFDATSEGVSGLYLIDWPGARTVTLLHEGDTEAPRWSPDGTKIAFVAGYGSNNGDSELYVMNADGSDVRKIANEPGLDLNPDWSPDGTLIARQIDGGFSGGVNVVINTAEGETSSLTDALNTALADFSRSFHARWSPDGTHLLVSATLADGDRTQLYLLNLADSRVTPLTDADGNSAFGEWSPDGAQIVFLSDREGVAQHFVMNADGSAQTRITASSDFGGVASWSADGQWIAFVADYTVYVVRPDGSELTLVSPGRDPIWRPCDIVPYSPFPPGG